MPRTNIPNYITKVKSFLNLISETPNLETARKRVGIHTSVIRHLKDIGVLACGDSGLRKRYEVTREPDHDEILASIKAKQKSAKKYYSKYASQSSSGNILLEDKFVMDAY